MAAVCISPSAQSLRVDPRAGSGSHGAILIAENDPRLSSSIRTGLNAHGLVAATVGDGVSALHRASSRAFDVLVLDPRLPKLDGLQVLRRLREAGSTMPVVMLSPTVGVPDAARTTVIQANAYLPKPFRFEKLLSTVRELLPHGGGPSELICGGLRLVRGTRQAHMGDYSVRLSAREFALAETLMRHPGQFLSRDYLFEQVWGTDRVHASNLVDVYVGQLRGKLGVRRISSRRGVGYRLEVLD